ncbi:MAG: hypothetical protein WBF43_09090 [Methylocella sp.]
MDIVEKYRPELAQLPASIVDLRLVAMEQMRNWRDAASQFMCDWPFIKA